MDYKDWIQNRAEEIANQDYDSEFYNLSQEAQLDVYGQAMEEHKEHVADLIDATRK